jgi:hypothetical protein
MKIYNTAIEQLELKQIAGLFPSWNIINPNGRVSDIVGEGRTRPFLQEAYKLIDKSDGVVATEYLSHIGKGVHSEICYALRKKKLVSILRSEPALNVVKGRLFRVYSEHQLEVIDIDWAVYYAKVYEGFHIPPLKGLLTVERIKAKERKEGCGVLDGISDTAKDFFIRIGKIQLLEELLGLRRLFGGGVK